MDLNKIHFIPYLAVKGTEKGFFVTCIMFKITLCHLSQQQSSGMGGGRAHTCILLSVKPVYSYTPLYGTKYVNQGGYV